MRVIHFSGGQTSAYMTLMLQPTADDIVLFTDTGREHPKTYKFINDFEAFEGIHVHRAIYTHPKAPGLSGFDALIAYKKYLPNRVHRICTVELKILTARKYLRALGLLAYESYIGFRSDEGDRVIRKKNQWKRVVQKFPLYDAGINKAMVNAFWQAKAYQLEIPSILGNCDCCFLKGKDNLIKIFQHYPELAVRWIDDESKIEKRGLYKTPATYIKNTPYADLLAVAQNQTRLFDLENALPAYSCSCTT